jgi:cysteine desulfurase/selenocysteine lyase
MLDVRNDFPFLKRHVHGKPIIYFDNAATTQKPQQVIDSLVRRYESGIANVHRAVNFLADEVTEDFEQARETMARFIGCQAREIIFTANATQAINIVCQALSLKKGKPLHVLTTTLEHHSNLLPWTQKGTVDFIPWQMTGEIPWEAFVKSLSGKPASPLPTAGQASGRPDMVTVARASNFLGTLHLVKKFATACREAGIPILIDASQAIAHEAQDVRNLGCDYLVFSGHKMYGPGGTGILYARHDVMEHLPPVFLGGSMIREMHALDYVPNDVPYRFEAGTPHIEGVIGLAKAAEYILTIGYDRISSHEAELVQYAKSHLKKIPGLTVYGPPAGEMCAPLVSFAIDRLAPTAVAKILGERANVIIRSGFHCAQPAHDQMGIGPTIRASFAVYNTQGEIDAMTGTLRALTSHI